MVMARTQQGSDVYCLVVGISFERAVGNKARIICEEDLRINGFWNLIKIVLGDKLSPKNHTIE